MSGAPSRFQVLEPVAERGGVGTFRGLDPLTGLPVLIYQFPGRPGVDAGALESDNLPGILSSGVREGRGEIVVAYSPSYAPLDPGRHAFGLEQVIDAARALRDAADAGVVHGDLRPERILVADGTVLLEGFGVPWAPGDDAFAAPELGNRGTYAGDVFALARALLRLDRDAGSELGPDVRALLEQGSQRDPESRPSAEELFAGLRALAGARATAAGEGDDATAPWNRPLAPAAEADDDASAAPLDETLRDGSRSERPHADPLADAELDLDEPGRGGPDADAAGADGGVDQEIFGLDADAAEDPEVTLVDSDGREEMGFDFSSTFLDKPDERDSDWELPFLPQPTPPARSSDPEPLTIDSAPDPDLLTHRSRQDASVSEKVLTRKRTSADDGPGDGGFVKGLPPDAKYKTVEVGENVPAPIQIEHTIDLDPPSRFSRRALLFFLLLLAVAVLGFLVFWFQGRGGGTLAPSAAETFPLDVSILPANLPPVTLYVVQSPEGSTLPLGANLGQVTRSRRIALDQEGTWSLQAEFQNRFSPVVTFEVPQQTSVTLQIPAGAGN